MTNAKANTYTYDPNGNQTTRIIGSDTYTLNYDAENRVVEVQKNGAAIAQFTYDGDGARVIAMENGQITIFVGSHYEKTGAQITKYYFAGSARIAARKYILPQAMSLEYLLGDHLGSTSLTTDANGAKVSEMRYKPFGELRYTWTSNPATAPVYALTRYTFTGQYSYMDDPTTTESEGFGLMFYNARWYDPVTGRFAQADSIVPAGAQGLDRYAYANNDPIKYVDPSGHTATECIDAESCDARDDVTAEMIESEFGVKISNPKSALWTSTNLLLIYASLYAFRSFAGKEYFTKYISGMNIAIVVQPEGESGYFNANTNTIELDPQNAFGGNPKTGETTGAWLQHNIVHESAHGLVAGIAHGDAGGMYASYGFDTGWNKEATWTKKGLEFPWVNPGTGPTPYARGELGPVSPQEDLAESVSVLIYPSIPNTGVTQDRIDWINENLR